MKELPVSAAERFHERYEKIPEAGCWLWTGWGSRFGHGMMRFHGATLYAHRLSWEIHNGPIPEGVCVLHRCDVPECVNPDHLFLGTKADNNHDCDRKGRRPHPRREQNWNAKLTQGQVDHVRGLPWLPILVAHRLAAEWGVTALYLYNVRKRMVWREDQE